MGRAGVVVDDEHVRLVVFEQEGDEEVVARVSALSDEAAKPDLVRLDDPAWPFLVRAIGSGSVTVVVSSEKCGLELRTLLDLIQPTVGVNVLIARPGLADFARGVVDGSAVAARVRLAWAGSDRRVRKSAAMPRRTAPTDADVDLAVHNPTGFVHAATLGYAVLVGHTPGDALRQVFADARRLIGDRSLQVLGNELLTTVHAEALLEVLRRYRGVVDHPRLHDDAARHALTLVALLSAGVPVICLQLPAEVRDLLGQELVSVMDEVDPAVLGDDDDRERLSVRLRRAAMRVHMVAARPPLSADVGRIVAPPVSVLLATNRPAFLDHALRQVDRQTYAGRQLVLALHGPEFPSDAEDRIRGSFSGDVDAFRVDRNATLGAALNACLARASGHLVTKMDDDDWYGDEHLWDLVLAHGYSRADIIGKGAEFVYLQGEDVTIRRFVGGAERYATTVAGGTLCASRAFLEDVGGFVRSSLGEDRALIAETVSGGGRVYRTHGFGYVLHRHGKHAWQAPDVYFSGAAVTTHPGAALHLALV